MYPIISRVFPELTWSMWRNENHGEHFISSGLLEAAEREPLRSDILMRFRHFRLKTSWLSC